MNYVIDCSFSSALFLPDEKSDYVRDFFINLTSADRVLIPSLWWLETTNVLNVAMRRKRLSFNEMSTVLELLEKLPLETDITYGAHYSKNLIEITQLYKLSAYDAAYIELAVRTKATLISLDKDIIKAAKNIGL